MAQAVQSPREERRAARRRAKAQRKEHGAWYPRWYWPSFAAPGTLYLLVFFLIPIYVVISLAFGTVDGFSNPIPVYQPWFWSGLYMSQVLNGAVGGDGPVYVRTFAYIFVASVMCVGVSYTVAYYIARFGQKRRGIYLALLVAPFFISYLMRMLAWNNLLASNGYINKILGWFPLVPHNVAWQTGNQLTIILGLVYGYVPYMVLPLYGFLDRIQASLLEAGKDLGASPVRTFFRVTLPLSKQAILAGIVIVTLPMFGDYYTHNLLGLSPATSMIGNLLDEAKQSGLGADSRVASLCLVIIVLMLIPMAYYLYSTNKELKER